MKLDNRGFAISGILYSLLILFLVLMMGILTVLASSKFTFDRLKKDISDKLNGEVVKVRVAYKDGVLNGADPILLDNMIHVIYDTNTDEWQKADITSTWYNYDNQIWANAVTVKETGINTRAYYLTAPAKTVVEMSDINAMFVWIPRFEYQMTNIAVSVINVNFIGKDVITPSSGYTISSAFNFGSKALSGFWAGKFENSATSILNTEIGDNVDTKEIVIKPNVSSWRYNDASTSFRTIRKMELYNNPYGFEQITLGISLDNLNQSIIVDDNNIDPHLIKNSEWGAIAYLTQSIYGKYGNSSYSGLNKELYINNYYNATTLDTLTGCSAGATNTAASTTCTNTYNTPVTGAGASTTGNIYGIYDLSGGATERVNGVYSNATNNGSYPAYSGRDATLNSGFKGYLGFTAAMKVTGYEWPTASYYNLYTTTSAETACSGICYGQAISETNNWYGDYNIMVDGTNPWIFRGYSYSDTSNAGIFAFNSGGGASNSKVTSRTVLTVE